MNIEVKKTQIKTNRQFATILKKILSEYKISEDCINTPSDNPLFDVTCDYVGLHHAIFKLSETLKQMADYQEMLLED